MKILIKLFVLIVAFTQCAYSQSVGINTSSPSPNAALDIKASGSRYGLLLPKVNLNNERDSLTFNGGSPADGLVIYNTNPNVGGGKGVYFWSKTGKQWEYAVSQENIELFRDLTRYYTDVTKAETEITPLTPKGTISYLEGSTNLSDWTFLKTDNNQQLIRTINVEQSSNFLEINLSGTWIAYTGTTSAMNRTFEVGYGIFIDGELKHARVDSYLATLPCNLNNFYINTIIPDVTPGSHEITFGVMLRRVRSENSGTSSFPSGAVLKIGGDVSGLSNNAKLGCKGINSFESSTKATVLVNNILN